MVYPTEYWNQDDDEIANVDPNLDQIDIDPNLDQEDRFEVLMKKEKWDE